MNSTRKKMLNRQLKRVQANATMLDRNRMRNNAGRTMNAVLKKWLRISPTFHAVR